MGYYSFLCWFVWRFLTAFLAHVNWLTAIYLKCIYFTYWKSFDLLWFWAHLALCFCFESLRPENYLLVWCTLIRKKCTTSKNKSFRQIYNATYDWKFTKSERKLKEIEIQEINEQDSDDDSSKNGVNSKNPTTSSNLYPKLDDEQAMPTLNVSRKPNDKNTRVNFQKQVEGEALIEYQEGLDTKDNKKGILSKIRLPKALKDRFSSSDNTPGTPEADAENSKWTGKFPKLLQTALRQKTPEEEELAREQAIEKAVKKEEDLKRKRLLKEQRERRKAELRKQAEKEKRRKLIADTIEQLLQCLRLFVTFAMLVGNVHKHLLPDYLVASEESMHNPEVLMLFTLTIGLELIMFWIIFVMTCVKQCHLCCRVGCCKFFAWCLALFSGIFIMYYPFHLSNDQLDMTWCKFEVGTDLYNFFDGQI